MSIIDNKNKIFDTLTSYTSLNNINKNINRSKISSINNSDNSISFLIDTIKVVSGNDGLKNGIGGLYNNVINNSENNIKSILKNNLNQSKDSNNIPANFNSNGYYIPVDKIDLNNKFKNDPNSDIGELLYNKNVVNDFDTSFYNAIKNPNNSILLNDLNLKLKYNPDTDMMNFKPINNVNNINKFINNYIDKSTILNKNEILTKLLNNFYGISDININKTKDQIINELKINKYVDNLINNNNIDDIDYELLNKYANELIEGVRYNDIGCAIIYNKLNKDDVINFINNVNNLDDDILIGNEFNNLLNTSNTDNNEIFENNKETIKDSFFDKMIKLLTSIFVEYSLTQPQVKAIVSIYKLFSGDENIDNFDDYFKKNITFIECIIDEIISMICEFLYNLVVSYLIKLLEPVAEKIINEKIKQNINIIKSLKLY